MLALTVPAACAAESPRDEAHRYAAIGPVYEGFTWAVRGEFQEGLAPVENGQRLNGYIDPTGAMAIPCQWEKAEAFSEGLARVWLDGKCSFIDRTGA